MYWTGTHSNEGVGGGAGGGIAILSYIIKSIPYFPLLLFCDCMHMRKLGPPNQEEDLTQHFYPRGLDNVKEFTFNKTMQMHSGLKVKCPAPNNCF